MYFNCVFLEPHRLRRVLCQLFSLSFSLVVTFMNFMDCVFLGYVFFIMYFVFEHCSWLCGHLQVRWMDSRSWLCHNRHVPFCFLELGECTMVSLAFTQASTSTMTTLTRQMERRNSILLIGIFPELT